MSATSAAEGCARVSILQAIRAQARKASRRTLSIVRQVVHERAHYFSAAPYDGLRKDQRVREMFARVSAR